MVIVTMPPASPSVLPGVIMIDGGACDDNYIDFRGTTDDDKIIVDRRGGRQVMTETNATVTIRRRSRLPMCGESDFRGKPKTMSSTTSRCSVSVLEGDKGEDQLVNGHVSGKLDTGTGKIGGPVIEGADGSFLLGGDDSDGLWGSGNNVTYLPDAYGLTNAAGAIINVADDPADGDIVSFSSGINALIITLGADCLRTSCGSNLIISSGSLTIDVCAWLYATFQPLSGIGSGSTADRCPPRNSTNSRR